jgi:urease accessory protein
MPSFSAMPHTPVERVLGSIADFPTGMRRVERAVLRSDDLAKRLLRVPTSIGDLGLRTAKSLHDGDVIYADDEVVVCITIAPDDLLVVKPATIAQAIEIAHALGNRHLPIQRTGDTIVLRYDPLVEDLLRERRVDYAREQRQVGEPFRHAHAPHTHSS